MRIPYLPIALAWLPVLLGGCVTDHLPAEEPRHVEAIEIELPPSPPRALTVGVYNCLDTTGQRRSSGLPQELSTAVPMDCTPYLIEAVRSLTPGYLRLVERQHADSLLRERQIATLTLNANAAPGRDGQPAPARRLTSLRVAEMLLIGQVVAYDRSTKQISAGIGLGNWAVSGTSVSDVFSFSLRAVAVQTGEVLGQVTVTKSVVSMKVGGHFTRIWPTTIIDTELGGAANEPIGFALRLAVRGAVTELVQRGIKDGWWAS